MTLSSIPTTHLEPETMCGLETYAKDSAALPSNPTRVRPAQGCATTTTSTSWMSLSNLHTACSHAPLVCGSHQTAWCKSTNLLKMHFKKATFTTHFPHFHSPFQIPMLWFNSLDSFSDINGSFQSSKTIHIQLWERVQVVPAMASLLPRDLLR